jgi:uncharacterized membrane protein YphA (DoxX/SURF4 family)
MSASNQTQQQVTTVLKYTYGLVPIVAGLDKFTNLLTNWSDYLGTTVKEMLPLSPSAFMMVVGVIEIIAGILVLIKPAIGAWVVSAWLVLIALSLIASGQHFDVAVRDVVMAVGAYSLAKLSAVTKEV